MIRAITLCCLIVAFGNCAKLPSGIERCEIGNAECIRKTAQMVIDSVGKSTDYKKFNLPDLNPFHAEKILLQQGSDSPVNIELNLKSVDLYGLNTITIKKIIGFERGFKKPIVIDFSMPNVKFVGNYTIDGRVLILPIIGDGLFNLELNDVEGSVKFKVKLVEHKGKEYIKIQNFKIKLEVSRMQVNFDNLYNGNKLLGDNTNLFINENWRAIFEELRENIYDIVGQVLVGNSDAVLSKFSYSELFIDDEYRKS